jgi:hypothetical protein
LAIGNPIVLNAHHIISFANLLKKYKITTLQEAISCKELWDINIGLTLCIKCHNKTKGGTKNEFQMLPSGIY